ncbi:OPSX-like protein [Mya arenaria]|uniref:OPSX-like protein n=1 Tax=Mya arenaria TaxID=6604 RepID=A0ABY7F2K9_MYAAR|nr:OPSX-like protein [Mya arenaria]
MNGTDQPFTLDGGFNLFEHRSAAMLFFYSAIFGVIGNLQTLRVLVKDHPLSMSSSRIHVQMAIANILVAATGFQAGANAWIGRWVCGDAGCKAYGFFAMFGGMASVTLAAMYDFQSRTGGLLTGAAWVFSLVIATGPLMGWNSYALESSGTSCLLDWRVRDQAHISFFLTIGSVFMVLMSAAIFGLRSAIMRTKTDDVKGGSDWFTESQLNWMAVGNLMLVLCGYNPYLFLAIWSVASPAPLQMGPLAPYVMALMVKCSTLYFPLIYCTASKQFRTAYYPHIFGEKEKAAWTGSSTEKLALPE